VVTGAGGGIGTAIVERFYEEGCNVIAADLEYAKVKILDDNHNVIAVHNDVTDLSSCQNVMRAAMDVFGSIDILICNAGIMQVGGIDQISPEHFERIINVNLIGTYHTIKAAEPYLPAWASIVITASKSAKRSSGGLSAYASSKHALLGLAQALAYELGERKIRVNCVCPGDLLESPLFLELDELAKRQGITSKELRRLRIEASPLKEYCRYQDVCEAIVFLSDSEKSRHTTAQDVDITGGVMVN